MKLGYGADYEHQLLMIIWDLRSFELLFRHNFNDQYISSINSCIMNVIYKLDYRFLLIIFVQPADYLQSLPLQIKQWYNNNSKQ